MLYSERFDLDDRHFVCIKDIFTDDSLQVRRKVDPKVVSRYAENMKAGDRFPPIELADIEGKLYLVSGWHRLDAVRQCGELKINANVQVMTYKDAMWAAATANLAHGSPIKDREYRNVFKACINAGKHKVGRRWLSYRDLGAMIGKSHETIRKWMLKDFPKVYSQYQKPYEQRRESAELPDLGEKMKREAMVNALSTLDNVGNAFKVLDLERRGILISKMEAVLKDLGGVNNFV